MKNLLAFVLMEEGEMEKTLFRVYGLSRKDLENMKYNTASREDEDVAFLSGYLLALKNVREAIEARKKWNSLKERMEND